MSRGRGKRRHPDPIPIPDDVRNTPASDTSGFDAQIAGTADYQPGTRMGAVVVNHLVTAMLIVMAVVTTTWAYLTFKDGTGELSAGSERSFFEPALTAQADRVRFAVGVYHTLHGSFPRDLQAVVDDGLLQSDDLKYPPGSAAVVYERVGDSYQIVIERTVVGHVAATPDPDDAPDETVEEEPEPLPDTE